MKLLNHADSAVRRETLERLLIRYAPPLCQYLIMHKRVTEQGAEDLLQGFICERILERDLLSRASQARGRFRYFLMKSLDNWVISRRRHDQSAMRAPQSIVSLSTIEESSHPVQPQAELIFDIAWARQVLGLAFQRLRRHYEMIGRQDIWRLFRLRVIEPALSDAPPPSYAQLVNQLKLESESVASNTIISARRRFLSVLREIIHEYAQDESSIEEEISDLKGVLSAFRGVLDDSF